MCTNIGIREAARINTVAKNPVLTVRHGKKRIDTYRLPTPKTYIHVWTREKVTGRETVPSTLGPQTAPSVLSSTESVCLMETGEST